MFILKWYVWRSFSITIIFLSIYKTPVVLFLFLPISFLVTIFYSSLLFSLKLSAFANPSFVLYSFHSSIPVLFHFLHFLSPSPSLLFSFLSNSAFTKPSSLHLCSFHSSIIPSSQSYLFLSNIKTHITIDQSKCKDYICNYLYLCSK